MGDLINVYIRSVVREAVVATVRRHVLSETSSRRITSIIDAIVKHIKHAATDVAAKYISDLQDMVDNDELVALYELVEHFVEIQLRDEPGYAVGSVFSDMNVEDDERGDVFIALDRYHSTIISSVTKIFKSIEDQIDFDRVDDSQYDVPNPNRREKIKPVRLSAAKKQLMISNLKKLVEDIVVYQLTYMGVDINIGEYSSLDEYIELYAKTTVKEQLTNQYGRSVINPGRTRLPTLLGVKFPRGTYDYFGNNVRLRKEVNNILIDDLVIMTRELVEFINDFLDSNHEIKLELQQFIGDRKSV